MFGSFTGVFHPICNAPMLGAHQALQQTAAAFLVFRTSSSLGRPLLSLVVRAHESIPCLPRRVKPWTEQQLHQGAADRTQPRSSDQAAIAAVEFAKVLLGRRDTKKAYALMSDDARAHIPFEQFSTIVATMHPTGMPSRIEAVEFEPVPGQEAMNIFLVGESAGEKFYYRFGMQGAVGKGYHVSGVFRGNGPYPMSPLRQALPVKRSAEFSAAMSPTCTSAAAPEAVFDVDRIVERRRVRRPESPQTFRTPRDLLGLARGELKKRKFTHGNRPST